MIDIVEASNELSKLDLKINSDNMAIDVLWFRVMSQKDQWEIKRHRHFSYEFHFVAQGACLVELDNRNFIANQGDLYLTSPGVYHTQKFHGKSGYVEYSLNCDINFFGEANSETMALVNALKSDQCECYCRGKVIKDLFDLSLEEAFYKKMGFQSKIKELIKLIVIESARICDNDKEANVHINYKYKELDYQYIQIHRFIEDNINYPIRGREIAEYMHISEKQISRIIKKNRGVTIKELINEMKINKAKDMLMNTDLLISEISQSLGFSSQYYFNQFFRRIEGVAPSIFRKNYHLQND